MAHLLGVEAAAGVPAIAAARERFIVRLAQTGASRYALEGAIELVSGRVAAGETGSLSSPPS